MTVTPLTFTSLVFWGISSIVVFVISVFFAGVLIPQILLISYRRSLFDVPDERKIHQSVVPRLGGIAFKPVVFFSVVLVLGLCQLLGYDDMLGGLSAETRSMAFGFCSVMMLYLVGMADDLIGIRYKAKFVVQIACGLMMLAGGLWLDNFHGLFFVQELPQWIGYPLTLLAVVFIINAINLIDGIDGLASGLCGVATLFYGFIFLMQGVYVYALIAFATLGVLVPFFYYNVFGDAQRQRKIFMGDTGSLTIGMLMCILSLRLLRCFADGVPANFSNPMILAFSPLIIPCFDVVRVYLHRVRNGQNPFLPDKNHIHHKLLAIGMRQRVAMITIVSLSVLFTLGNMVAAHYVDISLLLLADMLLWTLANIWLTLRIHTVNQKK